ncbi:MAG: tRNA guanosine(15) transglycosylase TgtA [Desulfurococcales archaeon]|nr:tRNA guanosine(15) transglycosylase TgtA [Desulfurococcales archaeon]
MSFEVRDKELAGRVGKLVTKSGVVETPAFFPVINPFKRGDEVSPQKIMEIGFNQIITNSFIIKQRLKGDVIDVHKLTGFEGVVMTDSGAYQLLMYGKGRISIDPEEIVAYQKMLGSDIAVIADIPTRDDASYDEAIESVEQTLKRAKAVEHLIKDDDRLWVLPIQGGIYPDLVRRSSIESLKLEGFSYYAIGSPVTVLEKYEFWRIVEMVVAAKSVLPPDKPVHLFGGGHPLIMPLMVALGIDSFDSASYILYARQGRYITESGTRRLNDMEYLPCECEVCSKYTVKELMEMDKNERTRLLAIHNLHAIHREIKKIKEAIKEGRLWELVEESARRHPSILQAFRTSLKYMKWLERLDPRYKGRGKGIFLFGPESYERPELYRHRAFMRQRFIPKRRKVMFVPAPTWEKPFRESFIDKKLRGLGLIGGEVDIIYYLPFFDAVPRSLDQTYPYAQFESPRDVDEVIVQRMISTLRELMLEYIGKGYEVVLATCQDIPWGKSELLKAFPSVNGLKHIEICGT